MTGGPLGLQETHYELLLAGSFPTEEERDVLAWGCNAKVTVPARFKNNGKAKLTYKHATAMEVLVRPLPPMLYGSDRCAKPSVGEQTLTIYPVNPALLSAWVRRRQHSMPCALSQNLRPSNQLLSSQLLCVQ